MVHQHGSAQITRRLAAFTLVEIMIVVAVIALLSVIAVPSFLRARDQTNRTKFVELLRTLRDAFEIFATENGHYPDDTGPGMLPAGMASYLGNKVDYAARTPIGGHWDWDFNYYPGFRAGISVSEPNATREEMAAIDAMLDDGDLSSGAFRSSSANVFTYVVE